MTDWTPLADHDALPGDAAAVVSLSRRFRDVGEGLASRGDLVRRIHPEQVWTGLAARRFAQARDHLPARLRAVGRRCELAADALHRWGRDIEQAQAMGLVWRDRARAAVSDAAVARAHLASQGADPTAGVGTDWAAQLADAEHRLARARHGFADVVADHRDGARHAVDLLARADDVLDDPAWALGPLARLVAGLVTAPASAEFVVTADGLALNTPEAWRWETYRQAGIDPDAWDPRLGLAPLDDVAVSAWSFYADLYERRPDEFLWAGMATLAGGTFYGAFQDVHVLRRALESGAVAADEVGDLFARVYPGLPGPVVDELGDLAARDMDQLAREVRWVEVRFLHMQRKIFDDLAWQHVAYEQGGMPAMQSLYDSDAIGQVHRDAWQDIASGEHDRILRGNHDLLQYEQQRIIGSEYDTIRGHSPVTWAMTMGMSVVAHSPVPGGRPFRDVVPYRVAIDTPDHVPVVPDWLVPDRVPFTDLDVPGGGGISIDTPDRISVMDLPLNNVSIYEHRWQWIERDMLPRWIEHVEDGSARELVAEPIRDQGARQRLVPDSLLPYEPDAG